MKYIIAALVIVLGLIAWICTRKKPDEVPSPDEYWAAVEADEEARRGVPYSEAYPSTESE